MTATPYYLSELVPQSGLLADYPLEDIVTADDVENVQDYSGNNRYLSSGTTQPVQLSALNGRPAINHLNGTPLKSSSGAFSATKQIYMVVKYDLAANFGSAYRGLVGDDTSISVLVGDQPNLTKFFNFGFSGSFAYNKSHVAYLQSNQQAPFSNFELIELSNSNAFSFANLQVGQQTNNTGRRWRGRWTDFKLYSSVKNGTTDGRKLRLYYDLKFYLWRTAGTTLEFPDPTLTDIKWMHYKEFVPDWAGVTDTVEYADGGRDFNERTDTPPIEWDIVFDGLSKEKLQIFDAFANAVGISRTFSLVDKQGVTRTNVRVKSYESSHDAHKSWNNTATFRLCQYQ